MTDSTRFEHYKLYAETNRYWIEEKMKAVFKKELLEDEPNIRDVDFRKFQKMIRDIMAFESNPEIKPFYQSLQANIATFCSDPKPLEIGTIMQMIYYCFDNAIVEEPKKVPQEPSPVQAQDNTQENKQEIVTAKEEQKPVTPQKVQQPKIELSGVFQKNIEQYQELLKNPSLSKDQRFVLESALSNLKLQQLSIKGERKKASKSTIEPRNATSSIQQDMPRPPPPSDKQILLKKLKPLFIFACQQQQNIGTNTTFDRISSQCNHLNLGKFLIFCSSLKIPNEKLTRFVLIEKFKKISEGFQQINFDKYAKLLELLSHEDPTIYDRIHINDKVQRQIRPKSIRTPFSIRDKEFFRQMKQANSVRKELTSHSGKMGYSLKEQLENRKMLKSRIQRYGGGSIDYSNYGPGSPGPIGPVQYYRQKITQTIEQLPSEMRNMKKTDKNIFTLQHLNNVANQLQMRRISRLIVQDQDDDFMDSYELEQFKVKRPNIAQSIRKRANQLSRLEQYRQTNQGQKFAQIATSRSNKIK